MTDALRTMAEWAVARLPDTLREGMTRGGLIFLGRTGLRKTPVVLFRGPTRGSGQSGVLLVAGHEPWVGYIPQRFFQGVPAREPVGEYPLSTLPHVLDQFQARADLVVARVDRQSAQRGFGYHYLRFPEWMGTRLSVPDDLEKLVRSGSSIKRDMTLVRRYQYQPVVTQGAQDCDRFFHSVYVPFTQNRHGNLTFLRSEQDLKRRATRGGILWVQRNGMHVAAILYERKNTILDLVALGTVNGNINLEREGAISALYYFILQYACQEGYTVLDFRGCRPSLCDGLLRYKRKWGVTLYDKTDSYYDLLVRWDQKNAVVREFLSHTPLIFRDAGGFSALGSDPHIARDLWVDGLRGCYDLRDWEFQSMDAHNHIIPALRV